MDDRLGPYELNTIITGDARELANAIPDESVDLIFTDPVYDQIDDYRWLAETATRVLKPGGNCLSFVNAKWLSRVLAVAPSSNPVLFSVRSENMAGMNGRIIMRTTCIVWHGSGQIPGYMPDGFISYTWPGPITKNHQWTKNPDYIYKVIREFTLPSSIVFDPFTGGGTVPAVCKMLQRNYLAFEIDPATADLARERVANTQPPLPIEMPVQETLL